MRKKRYNYAERKLYKKEVAQHTKENRKFLQSLPWRKLRKEYFLNNPLCEKCKALGLVNKGDVVHHILPRILFKEKSLDYNNLETLCHDHHTIASNLERKKFKHNPKNYEIYYSEHWEQ